MMPCIDSFHFDLLKILVRGSYMRAYVLLNLLKKVGEKRSNVWLCSVFYYFFVTNFNNYKNASAIILDSIYHMKLKQL